jgi:hypothetical protein
MTTPPQRRITPVTDLKLGDVISSFALGHIVVRYVEKLSTGDIKIFYLSKYTSRIGCVTYLNTAEVMVIE